MSLIFGRLPWSAIFQKLDPNLNLNWSRLQVEICSNGRALEGEAVTNGSSYWANNRSVLTAIPVQRATQSLPSSLTLTGRRVAANVIYGANFWFSILSWCDCCWLTPKTIIQLFVNRARARFSRKSLSEKPLLHRLSAAFQLHFSKVSLSLQFRGNWTMG